MSDYNYGKDPYLDGLKIRIATNVLREFDSFERNHPSKPMVRLTPNSEALDLFNQIKEYENKND